MAETGVRWTADRSAGMGVLLAACISALVVNGMCFSIEPGIHLAGRFGVRIEDIVTVTPDGGRRLNSTDHGLRIVA
jgi:Xaa-Pro aminopeptidase